MNFGKILGSISPAFGMAAGKGLFGNKDVLGSMSPLAGMGSGQGLFGAMGGMGGLGLLGMLMGRAGHGGEGDGQEAAPDGAPQGDEFSQMLSQFGQHGPGRRGMIPRYDNFLTQQPRFGG
jgi:hypothetical protein